MLPNDLMYVALLFVLFVVPRFLQRYRLPSAVTSLLLGLAAAWLGLLEHDRTVELLSTFGIVALFLFAGLDVDLEELRPDLRPLLQYLALWIAMLGGVAWVVAAIAGLSTADALLVGLGLVTPSTGFILDSLDRFGLGPEERRWVKSKAIAVEILALLILFGVLQSSSWRQFGESSLILAGLILLLPPLFRWFAERIAPHAPRSEFAFLLMVAVLAATVTRRLGVYYLVGAFVVGLAARQFRRRLPAMSSEAMLHAVEAFASFFVPFYFFHAGQGVNASALDLPALLVGLL
ncbi:MAG TPA: cation:proton antiporter, partial [Gemmatimonadales bacterium]|nr:cation:proton antiporter [Gemmatimonadales bacterium]